MRVSIVAACAALSACATAAAAPPPPPPVDARAAPRSGVAPQQARPDVIVGEPGRELARRLLVGLADQAVEVRRVWSSPGYFLNGFELWERPVATPQTNICSVRVHRLDLGGLSEQARFNPDAEVNPEARAESVRTQMRFRAVGSTLAPVASPREYEPACAALHSGSGWFAAAGDSDAVTALQAFDNVQYMARHPETRMVSIECVQLERPCDGRAILGQSLSTSMITGLGRRPCPESAEPGCWTYELFSRDVGNWTVTVNRLNRPARVTLRQDPLPVS